MNSDHDCYQGPLLRENIPANNTTYCVQCDAEEGYCDHAGPRYLDPIEYEKGPAGGLIVPQAERERWNTPVRGTPPKAVLPDTRPYPELVAALEPWADISGPLEVMLRDCYEADPGKITRLVQYTIDAAKRGALRNPGGLLMSKLRKITA